VETKAHLCFLKKVGGAVGVYMEPRGRWTEKVWEPLIYTDKKGSRFVGYYIGYLAPVYTHIFYSFN
jgi:hypothetical protein